MVRKSVGAKPKKRPGSVTLRLQMQAAEDIAAAKDRAILNPQPAPKFIPESDEELLAEMIRRGGTLQAVAEAQVLVVAKAQDYNNGHSRDEYFPFGTVSYAQMLHTKALRFMSLTRKLEDGYGANFEGLKDTALDIINYAAFFVERTNRGDL